MDSFSFVPFLLLLSSCILQGDSIQCYICSFSPDDRNNRTDKCTDTNFHHQNVISGDCQLGCESVIQYDPNDEMEQWRRNCLQEGHKMTHDCQTETTIGYKLVRCTCNRDLCNHSNGSSGTFPLLFGTLIFLWNYFFIYHSIIK